MDFSAPLTRSTGAILFCVASAISIVLLLAPFAWHFKNRNLGACSLIFWLALANLIGLTNALIWPTDDIFHWWKGEIFCDIETKLRWPYIIGTCGSLACITRNLAIVMDVERTTLVPTEARRRRKLAIDLLFCYAVPVLFLALHYIIQPSRYWIITIGGCIPVLDNSWPTILLVFIWPPIFALSDTYYSILVVIRVHRYRRQFATILSSANSNLTTSRFLRLFIMSLFLCVIILPLQFWILSTNVSIEWLPYDWSLIHSEDWWTIRMFPTGGVVPYDRWIAPGCSFFVFAFFGIGQDAVEMYRSWLLIMGFAKFFPSLKKPRMRKARKPSPTSSSSLGSRARHYFNIRKGSTSTYATDESFIRSRNDSVCATETMQSVCGPPTARLPAVSEDSENVYGLSSMEEKGWQGFSIPAIPAIRGAIHTPSRSIWANDEEAQVSSMRTSILGGKGGMDSREKGWVEGGKVLVKKEISQSSEDT